MILLLTLSVGDMVIVSVGDVVLNVGDVVFGCYYIHCILVKGRGWISCRIVSLFFFFNFGV